MNSCLYLENMTVEEATADVIMILRHKKQISQTELSRRINLSRQQLYELENSKVSAKLRTIFEIADAFEMPVEELVSYINHRRFNEE